MATFARITITAVPSMLGATLGAALGATLLLGTGACTQLEKIDDGGDGATIPTEVQRAFDDSCAIAGCHDAATRAQGLELTAGASASIIGRSASQVPSLPLVELGNVEGSYMAVKILEEMPPSGTRMPPTRPPGPDEAIILGWIAGVALPGGGDMESGGDTSTTGPDDPSESGESTGPTVLLCGLEDVAPGQPNPFDIGTAAGQIPEDVGAVLTNNCGCHEVDPMGVSYPYTGMLHFSTIDEVQGDYNGAPAYELLLSRVQNETIPMPPLGFCNVGDGTTITEDDRTLLVDWLMAGAPDAANWP